MGSVDPRDLIASPEDAEAMFIPDGQAISSAGTGMLAHLHARKRPVAVRYVERILGATDTLGKRWAVLSEKALSFVAPSAGHTGNRRSLSS